MAVIDPGSGAPGRATSARSLGLIRPALYISFYFSLSIAVAMMVPALVDLADGGPGWIVFTGSAAGVGLVSVMGILALRQPLPKFSARFGFLSATLVWLVSATASAVPLWLSPLGITTAEAYFEAMSGLTTTGATVLSGLDMMPRSILLWRSILQWLGGIGIIALGLFLLPFLRIGGMQFLRTESSDRSEKALPRVIQVTRAFTIIYVGITALCAIVYAALGMSFFDAVNHAMTTVATGGFSTHDRSFGFFQDNAILWAAVVFMILGSLPFVLYVDLLARNRITLFTDPQVRTFVVGVVVVALGLAVWLETTRNIAFEQALTHAFFNVVSVITTTGYASDDYAVWGPFAFGVFFILTFIGGCAGSTTGGIKVYRFIIVAQALRRAFVKLIYPAAVVPMRYRGKIIEDEVFDSVVIFFIAFFFIFGITTLLLALSGQDFVTALTGAQTALTNVGPGLGETIGPSGNFQPLGEFETWLLAFVMLMGRLEIMTVIILFVPAFWQD